MKHRAINPKTVKEKVAEYFAQCENSRKEYVLNNGDIRIREETPSMVGLALYLGIHKSTLYELMNTESIQNNSQYTDLQKKVITDTLSYARDTIERITLERAINGDMDTRTASLLLNSYGYAAKQETNSTLTVKIDGATDEQANDWSR